MMLLLVLSLFTTQSDAPLVVHAETSFTGKADTLTLEMAYSSATEHFPRGQEAEIARRVRDLQIRNLDARFLPALTLGGQAVYQSDVPSIPVSVPGFSLPGIPHDQYRLGLTVDQLIYDGGLTAAQKAVENSSSAVSEQEVAVATYGLREQVEAAWFSVLLSEAETSTLDALVDDVQARLAQARSLVDRGAATSSNADVLEAELIRIRQQREGSASRSRAGRDVLEELTGLTLSDGTPLGLPSIDRPPADTRRPEELLFELTRQHLDQKASLVARRNRPKITTFADAAVGRPQGQDFFQKDIGPFYSLGVRIGWSLWDWNGSHRDREVLSLQADGIRAREDAFMQQVHAMAAQVRREIDRLETVLPGDEQVVSLRSKISAEARSKLDNGVSTATDFLVERNAEQRARLDEKVHRIQLAQARVRLATVLGTQ